LGHNGAATRGPGRALAGAQGAHSARASHEIRLPHVAADRASEPDRCRGSPARRLAERVAPGASRAPGARFRDPPSL